MTEFPPLMPSRNLILAWFRDPHHGVEIGAAPGQRDSRRGSDCRIRATAAEMPVAPGTRPARTLVSSRSGPTGAARVSSPRSSMSRMVRLATARLAAPSTEGPAHQYDQALQYKIRCNRFRFRAEQTHCDRCPCRRCAFSRRAAAASCCDRNQDARSCCGRARFLLPISAITTIGKRAQQRNRVLCGDLALEKQSAPEAVRLRTRECHSALTAMRRSRREGKRDSIYPHYSRVRLRSMLSRAPWPRNHRLSLAFARSANAAQRCIRVAKSSASSKRMPSSAIFL